MNKIKDFQNALISLENMTDEEFNKFLVSLPQRVQLLVRANFVNWREVLPIWYIKTGGEKKCIS